MGVNMQVLARLLIAATCVCLAACKSDAEKAQTTVLYSTALQEQARALPTTKLRQPQTEEAWRRFERACAQLVLIGSPSSMCEAASKAGVFEPGWPVFAAEEKLAWEALGEDQDRQTYQLKIGDELEHLRTLLANRLTADHWRWTAEVQANRDNMNTVILAGMNKSFQTRAFPDLPLSELNDAQLDALKLRLRQEGTLLAAIGRAGDKFHDETVS